MRWFPSGSLCSAISHAEAGIDRQPGGDRPPGAAGLREAGIETVSVYSQADAEALHVQLATRSVCIGPPRAADSYLNPQALLSAAIATGCDGLHPGYGFLSENPEFADACAENGITFIVPPGTPSGRPAPNPPPET